MNEVARSCGISKANIYHYYDSKDALLFDILDNYLSSLRGNILGISLQSHDPKDQLLEVIKSFLLFYEEMDHEQKIQTEWLPLHQEDQRDILKGYQREMVQFVSDILVTISPAVLGQDKSLLRDVTMSVFGMLNWFYMWNPKADRETRIGYANTVTALTIDGIVGLKQ